MRLLGQAGVKYSSLLGLALLLPLALAVACGAAATATPAKPGATLAPVAVPATVAAPQAPVINPGKLTVLAGGFGNERFNFSIGSGAGNSYARFVHGFLLTANEKMELIPGIASAWNLSPDGKIWTFTVRDGLTFHNGQPITAADVAYTWLYDFGPESMTHSTMSKSQSAAKNTEKIEQTGPMTVTLTNKSPDTGLAELVSEAGADWYGVLPKRAKLFDEDLDRAYDTNPVGAGIMKLTRHVPQASMEFERFNEYYFQAKNGFPSDRRVNFKSLDLRNIPEEATRVAALRAKEADIAPVSLATRKQIEGTGGRLVFGSEGFYIASEFRGAWNPDVPFSKKKVRQAMAYALDLKVFQNQLFGAEVFVPKGWVYVTPSSFGYSPDLDPFPYDPVKARQLMAEAGYPGGKGFGQLKINTWVSTAVPNLPESAQLAADMWKKELGLDVVVVVGDQSNIQKIRNTEGGIRGEIRWHDNEARRDPASIIRSSHGSPTIGARAHEDPALYKQVDEALGTLDPLKKPEAFNKLYKVLREEQYYIGVGYVNVPWGVGSRVAQWTPNPLASFPSAMHTIVLK
ncbi:MAG: ABC transporter substrate-binding protein [Dehalococcoidia bacterium]|nr:ABC transporter substrate-binding protein [Dehalococcoidia bacterium]MSQ17327.1 ABC transporter substrate-binding protein [Dehalococcoidia bacterium]